MRRSDIFGDAVWVGKRECTASSFSILRGHFCVDEIRSVMLDVVGLGFFKCYINGVCVNPDTFLPLSSEYEKAAPPAGEELSGHRMYVPRFDVTPFVIRGDNVIAIQFGGGWYTFFKRQFGLPKAIYRVTVEGEGEVKTYGSDRTCRIADGFIEDYLLVKLEKQNYAPHKDCFDADFDDSDWEYAVAAPEPETEYCRTDCPADALTERLPVRLIGEGARGLIYDCGKNTSGYPSLQLEAAAGEEICVFFSEELSEDRQLDSTYAHSQCYTVVSDGTNRIVQPEFTWYGFRYFEVVGKAKPLCVKQVHANIGVYSDFDSDNETLNWIYHTFVHTMLTNMHAGHPSDCPHIERRGYTGDGQLTCHAVLSTMDARHFYEKWAQDIADGQDRISGHIQYTAPYIRSGGGPGGWGCAIVEVPYQLYRHYGDAQILNKYYNNMRRYIDFLEAHSEFGLVTSDVKSAWCLGDWCGPKILYPDRNIMEKSKQQVFIPAPLVNTYFMVKSLQTMCEIAHVIGKEKDISQYEQKIELRKNAIRAAYFNSFDDNFIMNAQGANAYAVDLQLGTDTTYSNMVDYYQHLGCFDTGIFATDILTRVLFEHGDGELALDLLTGEGEQGFARWKREGATTFREYWDSNRSRSHNHPMFGAVVAYLFEHLLGIGQKEHTAGYRSLVIEPKALSRFRRLSGKMQTPNGIVSIEYRKKNDREVFCIVIPTGTEAVFRYVGEENTLCEGENIIYRKRG